MKGSVSDKAVRERALIERERICKANIAFEGIVLPEKWPQAYTEIFQRVYDEQINRYTKYGSLTSSLSDADLRIREETQRRARELVREAVRCRRDLCLEAEWRDAVERLLLHRFGARLNCSACGERLWQAEMSMSHCTQGENLLRTPRKPVCYCGANEKTDSSEPGNEQILSIKPEAPFSQDACERVGRPDRVAGLYGTKTIKQLLELGPNAGGRHGPLNDNNQLVYPFLIMEAKSSFGREGVEHAEAQTAFLIKACLDIQARLTGLCEVAFEPLVWFLVYAGDEVHFYGCVRTHGQYSIYDLWQGFLTSHDGALQILRIMDFVCEWAAKTFRRRVLSCLAGGRVERNHYCQTNTTPSIYEDNPDPTAFIHADLAHVQGSVDDESETTVSHAEMPKLMHIHLSDASRAIPEAAETGADFLSNVEYFGSSQDRVRSATTSHASNVKLVFRQTCVPADKGLLQQWLDKSFAEQVKWPSILNLRMALDHATCIQTTRLAVEALQCQWLSDFTQADSDGGGSNDECYCFITFSTYVETDTWQILRRLDCLVFSHQSLKVLCEMFPTAFASLGALRPPQHKCPCLLDLAQIFNSYDLRQAVHAALIGAACFAARMNSDGSQCVAWQYDKKDNSNIAVTGVLESISNFFTAHHGSEASVNKAVPTNRTLPRHLQPHFRGLRIFRDTNQVILMRGGLDNECVNEVCMIVFTDALFDYQKFRRSLAADIRDCVTKRHLWCQSSTNEANFERYESNLVEGDPLFQILNDWVDALNEETHASQQDFEQDASDSDMY